MYTCVCVFVYIFGCVCVYMCVCVRLSSCMSIQGCVFLNSPATVSLSVFVHVTTAHRYTTLSLLSVPIWPADSQHLVPGNIWSAV